MNMNESKKTWRSNREISPDERKTQKDIFQKQADNKISSVTHKREENMRERNQ